MKNIIFIFAVSAIVICACSGNKDREKTENQAIIAINDENEMSRTSDEVCGLFDAPEDYREGVKSYEENGKYGFKDTSGNIVIPAIYDYVGCFNEGLVSVTVNGKTGFINHSGEMVIPAVYEYGNYFSQGLACVSKNGKYGYINKHGKVVIDFLYDRGWDFWEPDGFAAVEKNGKQGLIDRNGEIVMPIQYESAASTNNGVAVIFDGMYEIDVYNDRSYKIISY